VTWKTEQKNEDKPMGTVQPGSWEHIIIVQLQEIELLQDKIQSRMDRFGDLESTDESLRKSLFALDEKLRFTLLPLDLQKLELPEDYKTKLDFWLGHQHKDFLDVIKR
jgi:hypothetical protein